MVEVAVEQAALVEKLSDRGNVARAIQDGHFGANEAPDGFQHIGVVQVGRAPDDLGEVVGDEDRVSLYSFSFGSLVSRMMPLCAMPTPQ